MYVTVLLRMRHRKLPIPKIVSPPLAPQVSLMDNYCSPRTVLAGLSFLLEQIAQCEDSKICFGVVQFRKDTGIPVSTVILMIWLTIPTIAFSYFIPSDFVSLRMSTFLTSELFITWVCHCFPTSLGYTSRSYPFGWHSVLCGFGYLLYLLRSKYPCKVVRLITILAQFFHCWTNF